MVIARYKPIGSDQEVEQEYPTQDADAVVGYIREYYFGLGYNDFEVPEIEITVPTLH